jgi:replicative DNA helicase
MLAIYKSSEPVDLVTVHSWLKEAGWLEGCGGASFLSNLSESVGFAANVGAYAKQVRQKAVLRRLLDATQEIAGGCLARVDDVDVFLDEAEEKIFTIKESREQATVYSLEDLVPEEVKRIEKIFELKGEVLGISSGFVDLDRLTSGWQNADLIILAARPSHGKTAMAVNMADYAARIAQVPTAFFSLEQPKEQLVQRLMASVGQIDGTRLRSAKMESQEWVRFSTASGDLVGSPLYIIDKPAMTPLEIRAHARRLVSRQGVGLIFVDYLQLIRDAGARSREQEIGGISRALKALAKELNVPVVALCQLNREVEKRPKKDPVLSDLRESGSIEQDADVVIFIYRDEVYRGDDSAEKGLAAIQVAKQRNGPIGRFKLTFRKEFMLFQNYVDDKLY